MSNDSSTGKCAGVSVARKLSMSPLYKSLPSHNSPDNRNTENLHVFHVGVHALGEHAGHVLNPEQAAARSVAQKVGGVETGLVLDQEFKLLVLDGFG